MADIQIDSREDVADWIETTLLIRRTPVGIDELNHLAKEDCGLDPSEVGLGLRVMRVRQVMLGDIYPFLTSEIYVKIDVDRESSPYIPLLLLSPGSPFRQVIAPHPSVQMTEIFERLTVDAMVNLFGPSSRAIRFGWPSDIGRPERFGEAIEWLARQMGIRSGTAFRPPLRKDGGVDVVAWRPFPDKKIGFPVALVQCTVQKDLVPKSRDIDLRNWSGWLALDVDPLTVLAVPGTIAKAEDWNEIALRSILLDRIRIAALVSPRFFSSFDSGKDFVKMAFSNLGNHLSGGR
jgi:hypothetical protein